MPRIPDRLLHSSVYLYTCTEDARSGEACGGSGFLVGVMSESRQRWAHAYAVTNSHVIREAKASVLRINTVDGQFDLKRTIEDMWIHHPHGDDVAVCSVDLSDEKHKFYMVMTEEFATSELIQEKNIGPGDNVFIVGRFMDHEGKQRNLPTARFGNIAQMPWEPIRSERGLLQESFLIDLRSIGGFSGSPVFVHIAVTPDEVWMPERFRPVLSKRIAARPSTFAKSGDYTERQEYHGPWLLGIDWGHICRPEPVFDGTDNSKTDFYTRSNTGMAAVVPAWKILDILNSEQLAEQRRLLDAQFQAESSVRQS